MWQIIKDLKEKRAVAYAQAGEIRTAAHKEGRDLSDDENKRHDALRAREEITCSKSAVVVWPVEDHPRMRDATEAERIRHKYRALSPLMDERMRRQWAAAEAESVGWGGVTAVAAATGLSRTTIAVGVGELAHRRAHPREPVEDRGPVGRRRPQAAGRDRPGAGRGVGRVGRPGDAGRPRVAAAVDVQEHRPAGRGVDAAGPPGVRPRRSPRC